MLSLILCASLAMAADEPLTRQFERKEKPKLLIVGTYHFDNPGLDFVKHELDDHLSPRRQAEIAQVNEALLRFRPTRVAVEASAQDGAAQAWYRQFREGKARPSASEVMQMGFRIAQTLGHDQIYPIDAKLDMDFGRFMAEAPPGQVDEMTQTMAVIAAEMERLSKRTVAENLRTMNTREADRIANGLYLRLAAVKSADVHPGATLVTSWYQRNLMWLANIAKVAAHSDDRVLIICGAAHASLLRSMLADSLDFEVVDPLRYLP